MKRSIIAVLLVLAAIWTGITVSAWAENQDITISVSKTELLTGETVIVTVSAPGAEAIRLYEYDTYNSTMLEEEGDTLSFSYSRRRENIVRFYAGACYDNVWSDETDITAVYFIEPYSYRLVNNQLTVSVLPYDNATEYRVILSKDGEQIDCLTHDYNGDFEFVLSEQGQYSVSASVTGENLNRSFAPRTIFYSVETDDNISIEAWPLDALTNQTANIMASAPGADAVRIYEINADGSESLCQTAEGENVTFRFRNLAESSSIYFARACYNGVWQDQQSKSVEVFVSAPYGRLPDPTFTSTLSRNQLFVTAQPVENAQYYTVRLDKDGRIMDSIYNSTNTDFVFTLSEVGTYTINVYAYTKGWDISSASKTIEYIAELDENISISISDTELLAGEYALVSASAPGAEAIRIYIIYEDGHESLWYESQGDSIEADLGAMSEGKRSFFATACYDGVWSINRSETLEVTFSAPNGDIDDPVVSYTLFGNQLTITVQPVEHANDYYVAIYNNGYQEDHTILEAAGSCTFTLSDNGDYYIWVLARTVGWNSSSAYITVDQRQSIINICGENVTWSLSDDGVLTISGTGVMFDYSEDNPAPWDAQWIEKVIVENGITHVGKYAFNNLIYLNFVSLPDSLASIGDSAFGQSSVLNTITLPASITDIGSDAFIALQTAFCYSDSYAYSWARENNMNVFTLDKNILTLPADTMTIEDEAFSDLSVPVIVEIPDGVTDIAPDAFNGSTVAFRCAADSIAAGYAEEYNIPTVPN